MRTLLLLGACAALSGCINAGYAYNTSGYGAGGGLVGTASPPNPNARNAEPQTRNSLPPFAEGFGPSGPNARFPDFGALSIGTGIVN